MPKFIRINQQFFDNWNPEMAYVLGFFSADGNLAVNPRGAKYLQFTSTDEEILIKIRRVMESDHKISANLRRPGWKTAYRIQIGSMYMFERLSMHGMTVNKSLTLAFPRVPQKYLSHFVRGYFDGDGSVGRYTYRRKDRHNKLKTITMTRFTSGSRIFLEELQIKLLGGGITGKGCLLAKHRSFDLQFALKDTIRLGEWMYKESNGLYLERKHERFKLILGT